MSPSFGDTNSQGGAVVSMLLDVVIVSSAAVMATVFIARFGTNREVCIKSSPGQYGLVTGSVRRRGNSEPVVASQRLLKDSMLSMDTGLEESVVTVIGCGSKSGTPVHSGKVSGITPTHAGGTAGMPANNIPKRASGRGVPTRPFGLGHSGGTHVGASPGGVHHKGASGAAWVLPRGPAHTFGFMSTPGPLMDSRGSGMPGQTIFCPTSKTMLVGVANQESEQSDIACKSNK